MRRADRGDDRRRRVRDKLAQFLTVGESRVIDELLRAWRRSEDPDAYARTVLADIDFGDRSLKVRGWHRVRCLQHLTRLTNVVCYGDFALLEAVAAVPHLRRLELVQNELVRDLRPHAKCGTLRTLVLTTGCRFLRDLSPLAETTVEELSLHLIAADLGTLRSDHLRRLAIRDLRLADGLHPLPADLPLRELALDNLPRSRSLVGVERWSTLEQVAFRERRGPRRSRPWSSCRSSGSSRSWASRRPTSWTTYGPPSPTSTYGARLPRPKVRSWSRVPLPTCRPPPTTSLASSTACSIRPSKRSSSSW
ncbi:MAG TPA: hypothetical protein VGJ86_03110 [Acidimicrobiales bacterium]